MCNAFILFSDTRNSCNPCCSDHWQLLCVQLTIKHWTMLSGYISFTATYLCGGHNEWCNGCHSCYTVTDVWMCFCLSQSERCKQLDVNVCNVVWMWWMYITSRKQGTAKSRVGSIVEQAYLTWLVRTKTDIKVQPSVLEYYHDQCKTIGKNKQTKFQSNLVC